MIPAFIASRFGPTFAKVVWWGGLALLALLVLSVGKCVYDQRAKTEVELSKGQAGAATASGRDAVATVGNQAATEQETDRITKENEDAIRNADGSGEPVAGGVRDAGLDSLCRRAAYRSDPKCLQRAAPR